MSPSHPIHIDWTLLTSFVKLKSLKLTSVNYQAGELCESVKEMHGLTELKIRLNSIESNDADDFCALDFISPLTALQSLSLGVWESNRFEPNLPYTFNGMTQLTKLHISNSLSVLKMNCLTRMADLKITTCRMPSSVLLSVLPCMTLLKSLKIRDEQWRSLSIPSSLLRRLQHLQCLSLIRLDVEVDFFRALATLSGLTELHFISGNDQELDSHAFRSEVNLLTMLKVLEIDFPTTDVSPLEYILEGRLLRLRDISFLRFYGAEGEMDELRTRLPCLEEISSAY